MKIIQLLETARSITVGLDGNDIYQPETPLRFRLNGTSVREVDRMVVTFYRLKPDTEYKLELLNQADECIDRISVYTKHEFVTLNVRDFGAKGDGITNDTLFIQAAIQACPRDSRVLIPKGNYKVTSLFLKSHINIEIEKEAHLLAETSRDEFPLFPGIIESYDEQEELNLGTWEGNPLPMFTGIITGYDVEDVVLYGEGSIDGQASRENWWYDEKKMRGAFRPRMLFLSHCRNVSVVGLSFCNSPAWTIHPYFSEYLKFYHVDIDNPMDSPNTDGVDPESCEHVEIAGCRFTLGDDCIAIKSGKIYMGKKYQRATRDVHIWQCLMENGHGAITVGSELAAGIYNVHVEKCRFVNTDRGLRIKTRRGRGMLAIVEDVFFEQIVMEHVKTPLVANSFYCCDPDGRTDYVQNRNPLPVDERTPLLRRLVFHHITCHKVHAAAGYFYGLPEQPIGEIEMKHISVDYAEDARPFMPAMLCGEQEMCRQGFILRNIHKVILEDVTVEGAEGEVIMSEQVDEIQNM